MDQSRESAVETRVRSAEIKK